jgi:hypothetical protein
MKNNKGFIATSLILTFFLLFCALLLNTIRNYNFNQNLIDKLDEINFSGNDNKEDVEDKNYCLNLSDEGNETLVDAINKYYTVGVPETTPGKEKSDKDEAVLAATEDDYGTSYYFRGNVTNNYVQFANKCWRIVRITGNGAIKLVLHNDNVNKSSNPCNASNNDTTAAFARYIGTTYTTEFILTDNNKYNDNAYVGFMYGATGASTYVETHANTNKSTILKNLETWYVSTFNKEQKCKLADTIWCNDKSTYQNTSYDPYNFGTIETNYGVGTNTNYYSAFSRIKSSNGNPGSAETGISPTLVCPKDDNDGNLSKYTSEDTINGNGALDYKIGLLTADEVAFAGGVVLYINQNYYLYENASGASWWTLSPGYFNKFATDKLAVAFHVSSYGDLSLQQVHFPLGLRPAVSLISSIKISGGTGTSDDPFIIA